MLLLLSLTVPVSVDDRPSLKTTTSVMSRGFVVPTAAAVKPEMPVAYSGMVVTVPVIVTPL